MFLICMYMSNVCIKHAFVFGRMEVVMEPVLGFALVSVHNVLVSLLQIFCQQKLHSPHSILHFVVRSGTGRLHQ